ncbi:carboxylesterase/lipase family protein [Allomuricauda sp. NBRC 101325]|uniref:carboxylesterase/lipase family protein n=1 Tax=Allomuricauda sp. NBRC 101325 TaxID=1113758 RepID=UPI0024A4B83D|nr:carboxylesterase family protein [Muricauda sp. NBRC 101325]GLU45442.1 carboxylic ester hydrolase [Muricauda sp. NBRC 101325]
MRNVKLVRGLLFLIALFPLSILAQNIVSTQDGKVKGYENNDVRIFKGIPFAQPPIGELRWKAPQPVASWGGVKECVDFGPSPIQNTPQPFYSWTEEFIAKPEPLSEDCLYLNVWTPAKNKNEKLPVFVWIYGGGFSSGSANCDIYDGQDMAEQGVVFVSFNYRVGVFGFMAHPELSAESGHYASGNYGLMDQLQALKWVKNNIEAFGGDPNNVTIAGQSAGSFSVNAHIASPLANGYFQKAIAQSGGILSGRLMQNLEDAEQQGETFMQLAGVKNLAELRNLSADSVLKLGNQPNAGRFGVVSEGYFLPKDLAAHFESGKQNQVPILTGWVTGDGSFLTPPNVTQESFNQLGQDRFANRFETFQSLFKAKSNEEAHKEQEKLALLDFAGVPAHKLAQFNSKKTWIYEFQHVPTDKPDFPNYGAFHTSEVPFALHTLDQWKRPWTTQERAFEDQMSSYWVNFAKSGDPNGKGLPNWKPYNAKKGEILILEVESIKMETKYSDEIKFLSQK